MAPRPNGTGLRVPGLNRLPSRAECIDKGKQSKLGSSWGYEMTRTDCKDWNHGPSASTRAERSRADSAKQNHKQQRRETDYLALRRTALQQLADAPLLRNTETVRAGTLDSPPLQPSTEANSQSDQAAYISCVPYTCVLCSADWRTSSRLGRERLSRIRAVITFQQQNVRRHAASGVSISLAASSI
ncbi:uncharacterized protein L969DRAFT_95906 [Mixia osmundae IAM 14324]|uniref:Uncharacterized protein n=1 Tax=Mixia osmundae (strain CBS 9802 / IAM 14324 / JCM 22182 / KY 12970) TaxID=764103 RepID=G7DX27_MIXOS|nr:uncharacterized protein L969DRAFT_95906 [Mixia osmundae IAM 14324]KEI38067.1 hypothetical protein L969DRAFT_95906 [Mixia osmundae IAM 14324]GAA95124.1 hypothetical protein E5Q_01779 [Mixia osmundae IAM 14324]